MYKKYVNSFCSFKCNKWVIVFLFCFLVKLQEFKNTVLPRNKDVTCLGHYWWSSNQFPFLGFRKGLDFFLPLNLWALFSVSQTEHSYRGDAFTANPPSPSSQPLTMSTRTSKLIQMLIWQKYLPYIKKATFPLLCSLEIINVAQPFKILREWQIHIRFPLRSLNKICICKLFYRKTAPKVKII